MKKTARITPRNIQFQEHVQITEIPREDSEIYIASEQPSWDPNLYYVYYFFFLQINLFCF
jgi:hypothetical protein